MKVKWVGGDTVAFDENKIYTVMAIKHGMYQVMTELDEAYYFPPDCFIIISV